MKNGGNKNHPKEGDKIAVDPIRKLKDIKAIAKLTQENPRDHLLFIMGVNNGIRVADLIKLRIKDVRGLKVGHTLTITESKTGKKNILVINKIVFKALNNSLYDLTILLISKVLTSILCFLQVWFALWNEFFALSTVRKIDFI